MQDSRHKIQDTGYKMQSMVSRSGLERSDISRSEDSGFAPVLDFGLTAFGKGCIICTTTWFNFNKFGMLLQQDKHVAGLPQNEFNRSNEFNQSKPYHIKQFRGIVIQDTIKRVATLRFIRGVLRQLGLLGKSTGGVRPQTNIGNSASDNEFMTHDVIGIYRSNIELVKALAAHYGFQYIFYWQPTIFQKTHLTAYEESERRKQREIQPFFQKTYKYLAEQRNFAKGESYKFHNLSYIFSDVQEPLFVDWIHLGELGNAIIADRMVADVLAIVDGNKRSGQ